jgi:hypothetical protein
MSGFTVMPQMKYDFIVHPGGNVNAIAMQYTGVDKIEVKDKELPIKLRPAPERIVPVQLPGKGRQRKRSP